MEIFLKNDVLLPKEKLFSWPTTVCSAVLSPVLLIDLPEQRDADAAKVAEQTPTAADDSANSRGSEPEATEEEAPEVEQERTEEATEETEEKEEEKSDERPPRIVKRWARSYMRRVEECDTRFMSSMTQWRSHESPGTRDMTGGHPISSSHQSHIKQT